jgi:hypothetical protein
MIGGLECSIERDAEEIVRRSTFDVDFLAPELADDERKLAANA